MNGARRRVVVGTDDAGRSVVVADEELTALQLAPRGQRAHDGLGPGRVTAIAT
jgi:hypothetical protein